MIGVLQFGGSGGIGVDGLNSLPRRERFREPRSPARSPRSRFEAILHASRDAISL